MNLDAQRALYLHVNADCIPVRGALQSAVYDLTRHEIILFPTAYYTLLRKIDGVRVSDILEELQTKEATQAANVLEFVEFLYENELILFTDDVSAFPAIEERWEMPGLVQNAVVDVDGEMHDFRRIVDDLDQLGCQFLQIRSFSSLLGLRDAHTVLSLARNTSIESVELILKFEPEATDEDYRRLVVDHPILFRFTVHSSPVDRELFVDYGCVDLTHSITKSILFVSQAVDSHLHCGRIDVSQLTAPTVSTFFEAKLFNGCLNGKVAVDSLGRVKNCRSMEESFGNVRDTHLRSAVERDGFRTAWSIRKDQIEICKDCELRYACSDCRAYLDRPDDRYSKPLKCGYDPYTAQWETWSENPLKQAAIARYGFTVD